ncbi:hypothetical protein VISI1226_10149 [Vibrio sinaloensis DSM 21326]|uniref:Uncharacterized protein n=1 Tax=Vibrio sinaloensis DSM 21326 TaxID=945550 RepID=E8M898_PHOS4|nr:hypothetical protein [Vibrio sinaloensis]EGA69790.1 hypothetical protein VISI1226_10149 [Vibrio sinaloensis DSM 21326]
MEDLVNLLKNHGFKAECKARKVVVKLEGLSNSVSINKDIAANKYRVKTNDTALSILACWFLFMGLYGINSEGDSPLNFVLISASMYFFVSVILTELKLNKLRSIIDDVNSQEYE